MLQESVIMSEATKIKAGSICTGCEDTPQRDQCVKCTLCDSVFHAICPVVPEAQLGSKTMVKTFVSLSTKSNFKFFCDICSTKFESDMETSGDQKMTGLLSKVSGLEDKKDQIMKLLPKTAQTDKSIPIKESIKFWSDENAMRRVKDPESILVIKKSATPEQNHEIHDEVQQTMERNNIPVDRSVMKKEGDTVMVFKTKNDRDKLKGLLENSNQQIETTAPSEKRPSIAIVGLKRQYEKDEIVKMLELQNGFIKRFASTNNLDDHIEVFAIRPLKNNAESFQAFANVSTTLREGLNIYKNRVTIGLVSCKVYDRFHVKRCNNCQHFGHYMKDCPSPETTVCGKCSGNHNTRDCESDIIKCINCVREKRENDNHHTFHHTCPSLCAQQDALKKKMNGYLNLATRSQPPPR